MAREVRQYAATITAGTTVAAPMRIPLSMPARIVRRIRWRVPPGPSGLMGWRLGSGGVAVIPWNDGAWIIADDEWDEWLPEGQITSGAWELQGYNGGTLDHTVYLTFELDPPQLVDPAALVVYDYGSAGSSGGGGTVPPADPGAAAATYADGWAVGRSNALAAMAIAYGDPDAPALASRPEALTDAGNGYDDAKAAALVAVGDVGQTQGIEDVPTNDGRAIAKARAVAAVATALDVPVTGTVPEPPYAGDPTRAEYDRGRLAALAALSAITLD